MASFRSGPVKVVLNSNTQPQTQGMPAAQAKQT